MHLEAQLTQQTSRMELQKQEIGTLKQDKKGLEEEVLKLRWEHLLTKSRLTRTKHKLEEAGKEITGLREALRIARLPKNSSNSSMPPSTDFYKPERKKNYSLRDKSGRKPGGQHGHQGATLGFCSDAPNREIFHTVDTCSVCGKDLTNIPGEKQYTHQVVDITVPRKILINHTTIAKYCSCGHCNKAVFPAGAEGQVNYGKALRGLVANLSVRQYMPYKRMVEFIHDFWDIPISQGTITNLLEQFKCHATGEYNRIRNQVLHSDVVGADETTIKVSGTKNWLHTYQTTRHTFIGYHPSRGKKAQEAFYPLGLPNSILVTDCLAMQLSTPAAAHQVCLAHLLRELNAMEETHPEQKWPTQIKALFHKALSLPANPYDKKEVNFIEKEFEELIKSDQSSAPGKISAFWKRLNTHQDKVFTFLHYPGVPPDNNASERAIRNAKVKQKISGQFKTREGASRYAIIRSIIDTAVKQHKNVHEELARIASLDTG